ncbi:MAG: trimethylamine methyltransferase family protein [Alphaproteobacteria bacterium]
MVDSADSHDAPNDASATRSKRETRGGGREGRRASRASSAAINAPSIIKRQFQPFNLLSESQLDQIEANANKILTQFGIDFRDDPETLDLLRDAGCSIDGERVRFPDGLCQSLIAHAPRQFTQHARNPSRNVEIGGDHMVLVPAYGPPFIRNLDEGRRYATLADFENFVKLAYLSPGLHHSGGTVCEPVDVPVPKRHLDMVYAHMRYSDKPFMGSVTAPERAQDSVDMCKILFGADFVDQNCVMVNLINANSPMVWDGTMLGALKVYARNNQACMVSPFILSGAMSPVTAAGTLSQLYAEVLSGAALTQLVRKGAPVIFGTFAASISMQSGAPTFGTPEASWVLYGAGQLARRLGIPFRSGGGLNGSKIPDAQAAFEAANTLQTAMLGGVNFMLHTAGWLEGGLVMSYEKFVMDADQAAMMSRFADGPDFSENGQAMDAIEEVGPGSHFLGAGHTLRNFETAFYRSPLTDNNSFEQWEQDGSKDMIKRANAFWKAELERYQPPPLDVTIDQALKDFIAARKAELPDSSY